MSALGPSAQPSQQQPDLSAAIRIVAQAAQQEPEPSDRAMLGQALGLLQQVQQKNQAENGGGQRQGMPSSLAQALMAGRGTQSPQMPQMPQMPGQ